jgi:hypothetical protein
MEEDREATNLGPSLDEQLESEVPVSAKQPKRRFIGRRAADQAAQSRTGDASIEDSGAIQGVNSPILVLECICPANIIFSYSISTSSESPEQYST